MSTTETMAPPLRPGSAPPERRDRRRVLIVDDDEWIRECAGMALADEGYDVATAPDGAAALELLEGLARSGQQAPDVILLDMRMPVVDGWTFARTYRARPLPRVPIVVISAAADAGRCAADVAADGALAKPFTLDELLAVVYAFTRQRSA